MLNKIKNILQNHKYAKPLILLLFSISIFLLYNREDNSYSLSQPIPVEADIVKVGNVEVYFSSLGTIMPKYQANIMAEINGKLTDVAFEDGQLVKKGDLLAKIEDSNYKAQLLQYEGQLLRDSALLDNAKLDLKRYKLLWQQNAISKQILDTQVALVKQYEGVVLLDKGLVDNAQANLAYCRILAPFDGRIGLKMITEGNLVKVNDNNPIAVINMIDPIYVVFSLPEAQFSEIDHHKKLLVKIYDQNLKKLLNTGELIAADNFIDSATGTIKLKAQLKNNDRKLLPNQFVNVKIKVRDIKNAIIIPIAVVQYSPDGKFVYLVEKSTALIQKIEVGYTNDEIAVVVSGLNKDQVIVTSGVDRISNGSNLNVHMKNK
jgi:membrane fusion protein, multidrug efflux system